MSNESLEWQPPTDENDDVWTLDFDSIDGSALLYLDLAEVEGFEKSACAVIIEDSKSGNCEAVGIDFNSGEAEHILQDLTRSSEMQFIRETILNLRGVQE